MTRRILLRAVLVLSALAPAPLLAQRGVDIERFVPALDAEGFLGLQATATPGPGVAVMSMTSAWSTDPLVLASPASDVISHRVTTDFALEIGVGGRLALAVDVPIVAYQDADGRALVDGRGAIEATAWGDPRLALRYRFLGEDATVPRERNEGPGVALQLAGTVPVGDEDALAGDLAIAEATVLADFHVFGAGIGAGLGYRHRFGTRTLAGVTFRDELELDVGLKVPIPVTHDFVAIAELRAITDAGAPFDAPTTVVETDAGLRFTRDRLSFTAAAGLGLTTGVGSPGFRAIVGLAFAPRVHDSDGDGIPDERDDCDFLPEDFDGFDDRDGCLDPDNDGDIVPDQDDLCPLVAAEEFRDEDEDGCTDPVRDADGDGVEDGDDACPAQPEDRDGRADEDGCPDPDDDQDGVPDGTDQCPVDAEDRDGFADEDGCADVDDDEDGIADAADRCPRAAEDRDGNADDDGCPDVDDDHDGVRDADDRCATEPETINGVTDGDGCPDRGGRALLRADGDALVGTIRLPVGGELPAPAIALVDQLVLHLVARGARGRIVLPTADPAVLAAFRAALDARGVTAESAEVVAADVPRGTTLRVQFPPAGE